ncbi:MAG TPA: sulfite exporter TauE/SafE family protein [Clostridiaceae bacterium]|nr:sulfite exporter TauE/SafE family protein [Clostridiaceae bacterium]
MGFSYLILVLFMNIIEAIAGFGSISVGVPILSLFWGAERSVAFFTVTSLLMLTITLVTQYKKINFREFLIITATILPFMPVGYWLMGRLGDTEWALRLIIGTLVTLVSGREILRMIRKKESKEMSKPAMYTTLGVGSVIQGMLSMGAPLINIYALSRLKDKGAFRATMVAVWMVTNVISTIYRIFVRNVYTTELAIKIGYALPVVVLAFLIGNWLHHRISNEKFSNFVYIIQFTAGLISIAGGVSNLL